MKNNINKMYFKRLTMLNCCCTSYIQKCFNENKSAAVKLFILINNFYSFFSYYFTGYLLLFCIFIIMPQQISATDKHHHSAQLPLMVPLRYDLQIQLPTASIKDPLVPTFFGSTRIDFQLTQTLNSINAVLEQSTKKKQYWYSNIMSKYPPFSFDDIIELRLSSSNLEAFENVTLRAAGSNRFIPIVETRFETNEAVIVVGQSTLTAGRYSLNIERYQGLITYQKGIFYRDAGGFPVLSTDLFPNYTHTIFPCLGSPLTKTTIKLSLVHPKDTLALSSMHEREYSRELNKNWRITKFVQAPNLAAYMFSLAILPIGVYERTVVNNYGSLPPLHIWTNKIIHGSILKQELSKTAEKVYNEIYNLLQENLPLAHLDLLVMNEFNGTHSFGIITLSCEEWTTSDEAHRIALLARNFARQWFGGVTTISKYSQFCFQEDIVDYIVSKIVKNLLKQSKKAMEQYFLANYVRIHITESFFAPGESVSMHSINNQSMTNAITQHAINTHCSLKGAQMLHSLESIGNKTKELNFIKKLRYIIKYQRYKSFSIENFLELLRTFIIDSIDLAQVYNFWFKSGGIPNLLVEKHKERLRLTQLNQHRYAQINGGEWKAMPLWPLKITIRNLTLPITFMTTQAMELAPLDYKLLALTNIDFENIYRVNYDSSGWEKIVRHFDGTFDVLTARSRAQLLNDFCYFNAVGQVDINFADPLRKAFIQLMRDHYEHFELCELYVFWCAGGYGRKINMDKEATRSYYEYAHNKLWPALRNNKNYECGGPGAVSDAANGLCQLVFGVNCL